MQSVLVNLFAKYPCRYPLHWLSSAGSPCSWFSSPFQSVSQTENDFCLAGTPSDIRGFHEVDGAAFSDTSLRDHYLTKPIKRAKVHPLWTGSIGSHYQKIEDFGVQPIEEGVGVLTAQLLRLTEEGELTTQLFSIVIKDSTYCCEDIEKVDTGFY